MARQPPRSQLAPVRGKRSHAIEPETERRVVLVPRESGAVDILDAEELLPLRLVRAVRVTIPERIVGYEKLGE